MPFFEKKPRGKHAHGAHAKGVDGRASRDSAPLRQNKQQNTAGSHTPEGVLHTDNQRSVSFDQAPYQNRGQGQGQAPYQNQGQSPYAGFVSRLKPSSGQTASAPVQNANSAFSQGAANNAYCGNVHADNRNNAQASNHDNARTSSAYVDKASFVGSATAVSPTNPTNPASSMVRPMYQQSGGWQPVGATSRTAASRTATSCTTALGNAHALSHSPYQASPEPPKKKSKKWRVIFVVALVVLIASLAALGAIAYQYWSQQQAYSGLESYAEVTDQEAASLSDLSVDWAALQEVNPDVVAWIYVPGTPINYPIVQGADNDEYLHKAFDGSTGWLASAGTIFLDSINDKALSDQNNALYGHHMNDGSMFASVADWVDNSTFNAQRDIYIMTPEGNYRLKTFAVVKTVGTDAIVQTTFPSKVQFVNYIQDKIDRSVVTQEGTVLQAHDIKQSFLLSTCEYSRDDGRVVAFAAVVETTVADNPYLAEVEEGSTGITQDQAGSIAQAA